MSERSQPKGLTDVLDRFDAPPEARLSILRRAGLIAGKGLPVKKVADVIENSMAANGGLPDWPSVSEAVGKKVTDAYRRLRRQP
ncbi:MAG: hypothetical protein HY424_02665 [Candidatus Levybacteria bacterium]|nr:hypothetical protein [Candidatus Levybacteria bacterium]